MKDHVEFTHFSCWYQLEIPTLNMKLYHNDGNFPKAKLIIILFTSVQWTDHWGFFNETFCSLKSA